MKTSLLSVLATVMAVGLGCAMPRAPSPEEVAVLTRWLDEAEREISACEATQSRLRVRLDKVLQTLPGVMWWDAALPKEVRKALKASFREVQPILEGLNAADFSDELQQPIREIQETAAWLQGSISEGSGPLPKSLQEALGGSGDRGAFALAFSEFRADRSSRRDVSTIQGCLEYIEDQFYVHKPDMANAIVKVIGTRATDQDLAVRVFGEDLRSARVLVSALRGRQIIQWLNEVGNAP